MNGSLLWTWRVDDGPAVAMLINVIDLVSLLLFEGVWIVRFWVRLFLCACTVVASHDLSQGNVNYNRTIVTNGKETADPAGAPGFTPTFQFCWCSSILNISCSIISIIVCLLFFFFKYLFLRDIGCPCSNYGFWLHFWYLRTSLINNSAILWTYISSCTGKQRHDKIKCTT